MDGGLTRQEFNGIMEAMMDYDKWKLTDPNDLPENDLIEFYMEFYQIDKEDAMEMIEDERLDNLELQSYMNN